jgi:hypothetical protein
MAARLIYFGLPISLFARIPHEFNDPLVTFLGADIIYWNDRIVTPLGWSAGIPEFCATRGQAVAGQSSVSNSASGVITAHARGIKPSSLSRHKRIHSAKT